jgi:hypothetical protein
MLTSLSDDSTHDVTSGVLCPLAVLCHACTSCCAMPRLHHLPAIAIASNAIELVVPRLFSIWAPVSLLVLFVPLLLCHQRKILCRKKNLTNCHPCCCLLLLLRCSLLCGCFCLLKKFFFRQLKTNSRKRENLKNSGPCCCLLLLPMRCSLLCQCHHCNHAQILFII